VGVWQGVAMDSPEFHPGTPETALWPLQGWPACSAGSLRQSFIPLDTPRRTPMKGDVIRRIMSTHCIYVASLVRIDWKMMPQWSKTCIFSLVFAFTPRYATPRDRSCANYCRDQNVNTLHLYTKFGENASVVKNKDFWSFLCFLRYAMPRHAA
jgi:hypothetical protein